MKINLSLFLKTIIVTLALSTPLAYAQPSGEPTQYDVETAMNILKMEIGRDKDWAKRAISRHLLRAIREVLERDINRKETLAERLGGYNKPEIDPAIKVFIKTTQDELKIIKDVRVSDRIRRQTRYTLRDNIPKKEEALRQFQTWIRK